MGSTALMLYRRSCPRPSKSPGLLSLRRSVTGRRVPVPPERPDFADATQEELQEAIDRYILERFLPRFEREGGQPERGPAASS